MLRNLFSLAAVLLAAAACGGPETREYTLQGQVLAVAADHSQITIKHEEIPGFMAAMTMPYKARDAKEFEGLKPGDLINATLVVVSNDAYLMNVKRVGEAPLETTTSPSASSGFELLKPGEEVPNVTFTDQDGRSRDFASYRGTPVVVTFIYTECPLPTFCPLMDRHFKTLQDRLDKDPALAAVRLATVSFDPETDTPPVLKQHAASLGADLERWSFFTGDRDQVDRFAMRFGVSLMRDEKDPLDIAHNLRTAIVDANGRLVKIYTGNEWQPDEVMADLKRLG